MHLRSILTAHNVSTTALLTNYWKNVAKAKENWPTLCQKQGKRDKDLFKDPLMSLFVDADITAEAALRLDKKMWLSLATRTRFFRRTVSLAVKQKAVKQIIILGSGFDTLPARKLKYTQKFGVKFIEIDQPSILNCKKDIYTENQIDSNAKYIELDYIKENLIDALKKHDIDFAESTLILWEGNTFYLEASEVIGILRSLAAHFEKLIISFDFLHASMQTHTKELDQAASDQSLTKTLDQFSKKKSPFKAFFEPKDLISQCEGFGIRCIDHKTAAELAEGYEVDEEPYYTGETYSMISFER